MWNNGLVIRFYPPLHCLLELRDYAISVAVYLLLTWFWLVHCQKISGQYWASWFRPFGRIPGDEMPNVTWDVTRFCKNASNERGRERRNREMTLWNQWKLSAALIQWEEEVTCRTRKIWKSLSPILVIAEHEDIGSLAGLSGFRTRQEIEFIFRHQVQTSYGHHTGLRSGSFLENYLIPRRYWKLGVLTEKHPVRDSIESQKVSYKNNVPISNNNKTDIR
jgi:hypothetical protein